MKKTIQETRELMNKASKLLKEDVIDETLKIELREVFEILNNEESKLSKPEQWEDYDKSARDMIERIKESLENLARQKGN